MKAARRVAGTANAARGDSFLWVVGVDERSFEVVGAEVADLAGWWAKVRSCFAGDPPSMTDAVLDVDGATTIVAIGFEGTAFPYLVHNPNLGRVKGDAAELEVPWREGTATRSARRSDLIRLVAPRIEAPQFEISAATLEVGWRPPQAETETAADWRLHIEGYVTLPLGADVVIPDHRCTALIETGVGDPLSTTEVTVRSFYDQFRSRLTGAVGSWSIAPEAEQDLIVRAGGQAILSGPGRIQIRSTFATALPLPVVQGGSVHCQVTMVPNFRDPSTVEVDMSMTEWDPDQRVARWSMA